MKKWDYAELSKAAKAIGGPEKYIELLEESSKQEGRMEMIPWVGVAAIGAWLLTIGTIKIINIFELCKEKHKGKIEEQRRS